MHLAKQNVNGLLYSVDFEGMRNFEAYILSFRRIETWINMEHN